MTIEPAEVDSLEYTSTTPARLFITWEQHHLTFLKRPPFNGFGTKQTTTPYFRPGIQGSCRRRTTRTAPTSTFGPLRARSSRYHPSSVAQTRLFKKPSRKKPMLYRSTRLSCLTGARRRPNKGQWCCFPAPSVSSGTRYHFRSTELYLARLVLIRAGLYPLGLFVTRKALYSKTSFV